MHRSIAAAAAVVALTAALTACGGSDGDDGKAGSAKDTGSSSAAVPGGEKSPEATPGNPSSPVGKLGDTLALVGRDGLDATAGPPRADVTMKKFVDNAKPAVAYFKAAPGNRLVTAQFTILSTGKSTYHGTGYGEAKVVDTTGKAYVGKAGSPTVGESLTFRVILQPGKQATGWVLFEVPKAAKIAAVTYQMMPDGLNDERTGKWTLG
jgi:hypothetical protein